MATCSREKSRIVRSLLKQRLLPAGPLPGECLLRPELDVYLDQERHKKALRWNLWRCRYCGKSFVSEHYLDLHMDRKHAVAANATFCPGELCEALDCSAAARLGRTKVNGRVSRGRRRGRRAARLAASCEDLEERKERCATIFGDCGLDAALCDEMQCIGGRLAGSLPEPRRADVPTSRNSAVVVLYMAFLLLFYAVFFYQLNEDEKNRRRRSSRSARPARHRREAAD